MKQICQGRKTKDQVVSEVLQLYKDAFGIAKNQLNVMLEYCGKYMTPIPQGEQNEPVREGDFVRHCLLCFSPRYLRDLRPNDPQKIISCSGFPGCKETIWIPQHFTNVQVLPQHCPKCSSMPEKPVHLIRLEFKRNALPHIYESPVKP